MCGIAGFIDSQLTESPARDRLKTMADAIKHRGPDGDGYWWNGNSGIGLAHRRLSIIDLSSAGNQPMASSSERYVVAFNGEIFNFEEIRTELDAAGHSFAWKGHSDTEVLLAAIESWGLIGAIGRLVGMFAFALWDQKDRTLHLVRDRLGIKPLYYWANQNSVHFGSELKTLLHLPHFPKEIDTQALAEYFQFNCIPAPNTIYRGVYKLEAGTVLSFKTGTNLQKTQQQFWSATEVAQAGIRDPFSGSEADAVDALETLLAKSVKLRMISDVPLGAFLSGGIDSSTVVALMQKQSTRPIHTFSIENEDARYDEGQAARAVSKVLGTHHTPFTVTSQQAIDVIPMLANMFDEPFADSSQIPTYLVSKLARQHVTVALSGDGGDELFGGYNRHIYAPKILSLLRLVPIKLRARLAQHLQSTSTENWDAVFKKYAVFLPKLRLPGQRIHKLSGIFAQSSAAEVYRQLTTHWLPEQILSEPHPRDLDSVAELDGASFSEQMMCMDALTYLPNDILTKVDRASMAVGLEARVPLLDHRVFAFAWRLPLSMKVKGLTGKWALRQVLYRHVPQAIVDAPKMGFGVPMGEWLKGPLREWADDLLSEEQLSRLGLLNVNAVREKWTQHLTGQGAWEHHLWDVLMFQSWAQAQRH